MFSKIISHCSLFILMWLVVSCEEVCEVSLLRCSPLPDEGKLSVKVTINQENPRVPVTIFYGGLEKGDVVLDDTLSITSNTYLLPPGAYSATARYRYNRGTVTIIVVDGGYIYVSYENFCEDGIPICPILKSLNLNLELVE